MGPDRQHQRRPQLISVATIRVATMFAAAAVLWLAGCGPNYPACFNDGHCKAKGEYCLEKKCTQCREAKHCPGADEDHCIRCAAGACTRRVGCCSSNLDCGRGKKCAVNKCIAECSTDGDCMQGRICNDAGRCMRPETGGCTSNADCGGELACKKGRCINEQGECQLLAVPFAFNQHFLSQSAQQALRTTYKCMQDKGLTSFTIEGHCDERGTDAYNMELGNRRARAVAQFIKHLGRKIKTRTVSYGKTKPICYEQTESCWNRNRRCEFKSRK